MKSILFFTAPWCSSCKNLKPHLQMIPTSIKIKTIDIEKDPDIAAEFDVQQLPTLILIDADEGDIRCITGMSDAVVDTLYRFAGLRG